MMSSRSGSKNFFGGLKIILEIDLDYIFIMEFICIDNIICI